MPIMTRSPEHQENFRRKEAAEYLQNTYKVPCTTKTLANYASRRVGPAFRYWGRYPVYPKDELDEWARLKFGPLMTGKRAPC
jgi:hypothetical protein